MTLPLEQDIPDAEDWPGYDIPIKKFQRCLPFKHGRSWREVDIELKKDEVTLVLEDNVEVQDKFIEAGHLLDELECPACQYDGAEECKECGGIIHKMYDKDEVDLAVQMGFEPPLLLRWCDGECGLVEEI